MNSTETAALIAFLREAGDLAAAGAREARASGSTGDAEFFTGKQAAFLTALNATAAMSAPTGREALASAAAIRSSVERGC